MHISLRLLVPPHFIVVNSDPVRFHSHPSRLLCRTNVGKVDSRFVIIVESKHLRFEEEAVTASTASVVCAVAGLDHPSSSNVSSKGWINSETS